jgi:hypothetical protein
MKNPLITVLYDSINNSVFEGQVLKPLLKRLAQNSGQPLILISFERTLPKAVDIPFQLIIIRRLPFLGKLSLFFSVWQLKRILSNYFSYELIARGPLAGWVSLKALGRKQCTRFTVQARGLLAAEYEYTYQEQLNHPLLSWWHSWRKDALYTIEHETFSQAPHIEAVSPALKEYIVRTFNSSADKISIAWHDIPVVIDAYRKQQWRKQIRKKLTIPDHAYVYCYNGSVKAWQCPEKVVSFFKEQIFHDSQAHLLIITQNQEPFYKLIEQVALNKKNIRLLTTNHEDIYRYLAACDAGLIFREPSLVNWISRPTKILEYQAIGLKIVHNNTIAWLSKNI